ncbi:MAG: PilZ domain-containing protein, partial [Candidatus Aminicenantes bacterium]|nr:PilZ domain-containing protein [Candidatus Aminicenantes bacterium]
MKQFEENIENTRNSRRKFQTEMTCRFDDNLTEFPIWDISNNGFSFLCNNDSFFKEGAIFNKISIFNNEKLEVINGTGTIVSVSGFDKNKARIGIQFGKKRMDRMVGGKIRIQRHFPKIRIDISLTLKNKIGSFVVKGTILDYTASTARIEFKEETSDHKFQIGDEFEIHISIKDRVLLNCMVFVLRIKDDNSEVIINFIDQHLDIAAIETISKSFQNKNRIITTLESIKKFDKISDEYKALICDWRLYLSNLKNILDYEEK